jgi:endonuclease YncB( thermonuclease family)
LGHWNGVENRAKKQRKGIWSTGGETPAEYKKRLKAKQMGGGL